MYLTGPNGETFVGHLNDTWEEWASADGTPFYWNKDTEQPTWNLPGQTGEEEPDTPADEAEEEDEESPMKEKALAIMGSTLDIVGAAGLFPGAEATLIPSAATLASLGLNLYQKKIGWAMLDLIALVPVVGKFAKLGRLGKIAKTVATTGKTGKALATATKAMAVGDKGFKALKAGKAVNGVKELYEHVPEEYIRTAVYAKNDDGKNYIDVVLEVLEHAPSPTIKAGVEALKAAVAWVRNDLGAPPPTDPADSPEPGSAAPSELASRATRTTPRIGTQNRGPTGPLQETYDRWQTIAGINKRVL